MVGGAAQTETRGRATSSFSRPARPQTLTGHSAPWAAPFPHSLGVGGGGTCPCALSGISFVPGVLSPQTKLPLTSLRVPAVLEYDSTSMGLVPRAGVLGQR